MTVIHKGVPVEVNKIAAETYDLRHGEAITDSTLRKIVWCVHHIDEADRILRCLVSTHTKATQ